MSRTLTATLALTLLLNTCVTAAESASTLAPKSRRAALTRSLLWTFVPVAAGGVMMMHGQRIAPFGHGPNSGLTNDSETLLGFGIGTAGLLLGPSAGHAYASNWSAYGLGISIRLAGAGVFFLGVSTLDPWAPNGGTVGLFAIGSAMVVISAIVDFATVGDSVDSYNDEHGFHNLSLRPTYIASDHAPGLVLRLAF
jgi:hypothetical protein